MLIRMPSQPSRRVDRQMSHLFQMANFTWQDDIGLQQSKNQDAEVIK